MGDRDESVCSVADVVGQHPGVPKKVRSRLSEGYRIYRPPISHAARGLLAWVLVPRWNHTSPTGHGVKIEALMMKTVSAALLMWLVSILVPLRRCGAVSAKGTVSADLRAARRLVRWWDWELYGVCSTGEHC